MKFKKETYIKYWVGFQIKDPNIRCREKKIVKCRKEHDCHLTSFLGLEDHKIKKGEYALVEKAIFNNEWVSYYICIDCLNDFLINHIRIEPDKSTPLSKRDFTYLENKLIKINYNNFSSIFKVKIIEFDIGITLQDIYDERNCFCVSDKGDSSEYKKVFFNVISKIKKGKIDVDKFQEIFNISKFNSRYTKIEDVCPFSK